MKCDHFNKVFTRVVVHNKNTRGISYYYSHIILVIGSRAGAGGKEDLGEVQT